ncbi:hypothetical protein UlMin_011518 [Ulmus minor]
MQRLTGCIASLNRFIARAIDRSLPFFKALKKGADFVWTNECEQSFQELKVYLGKVHLLSKPVQGEVLSLYLAVSEAAVSSALVREEQGTELPVFYISKALIDPETRNITCHFGIPHSLVSDNGTQFDSAGLKKLCSNLGIYKHFSSVAHPQSNGQVEAVNKTIKNNLERKLNGAKGAWVDELPRVLWAYRTTCRTSTNETPFSMTYGTEVVVPTEIGDPSFQTE